MLQPTDVSVVSNKNSFDFTVRKRLFFDPVSQGRHGRRPGEEESDVDIEGFEEDDDGKPKTPAPVRETVKSHVATMYVNCTNTHSHVRRFNSTNLICYSSVYAVD